LNGHDGSAAASLDPADAMYWFADGWARRGFVVITIDIGHRPFVDRRSLYFDYGDGDDPDHGNGPHPAIAADGFDSDWVENGERAWDVMRAIDFAVTLGDVDPARLVVTGLSMGAEVATYVGALDGRARLIAPAGFVPDLA